jgi:tetratricopeptide (TPR) repeat protein
MGSRRSGGLLLVIAALDGAPVGGCAHGRTGSYEPTPAAAQACAGVVPLSVLVGPAVPETAVARGKALYCLALYEPALSVLADEAIRRPVGGAIDEAVAWPASPEPPPLAADRLPALRWLVYLHRRFPGWERINVTVGEVSRSDLESPELADVRDELHALAARFEYQRGSFDKALELLRKIPPSSPLRLRALWLEGAIHVRRATPLPALAVFDEALRIAPRGPDRELAIISLARVHYAMGQFETASRTYDRLPLLSPYWARAALEGAWASFQMKDYPRALARVQALAGRPGDVPAETMAEAISLEAIIALYQCRGADFERALERFNGTYPGLFTEVKRRSLQAPDALLEVALRVRSGGALPPSRDARVTLPLLTQTSVARRIEEIDELESERALYGTLDAGWRASTQGVDAGNELAVRRSVVRREAGEQLQLRLKGLADVLSARIKQALAIELEPAAWASPVPSDEDKWSVCRRFQ